MTQNDWQELYGPPATGAPYSVGESLVYEENGAVENGEILYVAAEPDLHYIVSPAGDIFPTPVWPEQIIASIP